jgi:hypothetical protein
MPAAQPALTDLDSFLKEVALKCFEQEVVDHPCRVALVTYDPVANLNQYVSVFGDWQTHCYHYLYPSFKGHDYFADNLIKRWKAEISQCRLDQAIKSDLENELKELAAKKRIGALEHLRRKLKEVRFYAPVTGEVYQKMQNGGQSYGDIVFRTPLSTPPERDKLEQDNNCVGEWVRGVLYEQCYLGTDTGQNYSVAFVAQRKQATHHLVVAASCRRNDCARAISDAVVKLRPQFLKKSKDYEFVNGTTKPRPTTSIAALIKKIKVQLALSTNNASDRAAEDAALTAIESATTTKLQAFLDALKSEATATQRTQGMNWIGGTKWVALWKRLP